MTQERLSLEEVSFSRVINTSEKNFQLQNQSAGIDLETYFQTLFQLEPFPLPIELPEPIKTPNEQRRQALDNSLSRLSTLEIGGEGHVEEYLRHQYRRHFQANTIRGSYTSE